MTVWIFVEGGAKGKDLPRRCREAFRKLVESAGIKTSLKITACGAGSKAYDDFRKALGIRNAELVPMLLVDSEGPVKPNHGAWQHLGKRPPGAQDEQAQLMAQCMETWIVTSRAQLRVFYGKGFRDSALPRVGADLEAIRPAALEEKLKAATRGTIKGAYDKGEHSFELLGRVNPAELKKLPRAAQFFAAVELLGRP